MAPRSSRLPYAVGAVAALLVILAAWAGRDRFVPLGPGSRAPDFTALDATGATVRLSDYRDKVVLLNIWATWCPPCVQEMPSMERLWATQDPDSFEILAVSVDAPLGQVDAQGRPGGDVWAFGDELGLTFKLLHNPAGDIQRTYQTTGVPESFLIGRDGTIYKKVIGPMEWDAGPNRELIERLLEGASP